MASSRRTGTNENVSTYGDGTRQYTSLATWESATDYSLTGSNVSEILEVYGDAVFDDTAVFNGATTSSSYVRAVRAATGHAPNYKAGTGAIFTPVTLSSNVFIDCNDHWTFFNDLGVFDSSWSTGGSTVTAFKTGGEDQNVVCGCIVAGNDNTNGAIRGFYSNGNNFFVNCFFHDNTATGTVTGYQMHGAETNRIFNNLALQVDVSFYRSGATARAYNCYTDVARTGSWTQWVTSVQTGGATFRDAAGGDYHLAAADTVCRDNGTDASSHDFFPFDDDIDFEIRVAWDIGPDEYSASGGVPPLVGGGLVNKGGLVGGRLA